MKSFACAPLFLAALVVVPASAAVAESEALARAQGFVPAIPASGAVDVPTNALIFVRDEFFTELRLVDDGGAIAEVTISTAVGHFSSLLRLSLNEPLRPRTTYRLIDVVGNEEASELTSFTTGDGGDDDPPTAPLLEDRGAIGGGGSLGIVSNEPVEVVSVSRGGTTYFDVVDTGGVIVEGQGETVVSIIAFDRAGNPSEPVSIDLLLGLPDGLSTLCCFGSPTSSPTAAAPFGLALVALRRRQRTRARR